MTGGDTVQDIVNRVIDDGDVYLEGSLEFSCSKLEIVLAGGEDREGSFRIVSASGNYTNGYVYSSDHRMECLVGEFSGNDEEIFFRFNGSELSAGEVVKGAFFVISNHGEHQLPFEVTVGQAVPESSIGTIKNLFHFANLARTNWKEAVELFYSPAFPEILTGNDAKYLTGYKALSVHAGNETNVEEFLVYVNKKQRVEFLTDTKEMVIELTETDIVGTLGYNIQITRNGHGYTELSVECDGPFLYAEREILNDDAFMGNKCTLAIYVDGTMLRHGNNFGRVSIYNTVSRIDIPVVVNVGSDVTTRNSLTMDRSVWDLMELYQNFRLKKIGLQNWLNESARSIETIIELDENGVGGKLFKAQLLITEDKINEAEWMLNHSANMIDEWNNPVLWAYYLYLTSLLGRDEEYINEVTNAVADIYDRDRTQWRVAWLLLFLVREYSKSPLEKWDFLKDQFDMGCNSPMLYVEAICLLNSNPTILRTMDDFEQHVLNYGVKMQCINENLKEQIIGVCERRVGYSKLNAKYLNKLYKDTSDDRILNVLVTMLIREGFRGPAYYKLYREAVEKELRVTNLYEYFMESIPSELMDINRDTPLPKIAMMYFAYRNELDYERQAYLYAYVVKHKEELPELIKVYNSLIEGFVIDQIQKEHMDENLAYLYRNYLSAGMIGPQTARSLSRLLFAGKPLITDRNIRRILVYQNGNLEPDVYQFNNGKTWIPVYGNECVVVLEDGWNNRFVLLQDKLVDFQMPDRFVVSVAELVPDNTRLNLYLNARDHGDINSSNVGRIKSLLSDPLVDGRIKKDRYQQLMYYYYDRDDMEALDQFLTEIPMGRLAPDERRSVFRYMVLRGEYDVAYRWLQQYGPDYIEAKVIVRLLDVLLNNIQMERDDFLLACCVYALKLGKCDTTILEYLNRYYCGPLRNMRDIWKACVNLQVPRYELCERMICQMLFSNAYIGERTDVFNDYVSMGARPAVEDAFLVRCAYDYFVEESLLEDSIFEEMMRLFRLGESLNRLEKLALLKYFSENMDRATGDRVDMINVLVNEMLAEGLVLNLFREFGRIAPIVGSIEDKTVVEYRTEPGSTAEIHYVIMKENGEASEYLCEPMTEVCAGVFFKSFILFFGESLQFYIMENKDGNEQLTESGSIPKSEIIQGSEGGRYNCVNDIIISKTLQDFDTMDDLVNEYFYKDYLVRRMFKLV